MVKSELTDGTKIFVVKTEHYVSLSVFIRAIRNEFYSTISEEVESIISTTEHSPIRGFFDSESFEVRIDEYIINHPFFKKLTKSKSEKILRHSLKMYGREGDLDDTLYEASYERGYVLEKCYDIAREWVIKNYPYLITE